MRAADGGLLAYAEELRQEILVEADDDDVASFLPEVLTRHGIETLTEIGELETCVDCYLQQRGIEVSGYGIDDGDTLNLTVTIHRGEVPPSSVTRTDITTAFRRALGMWERCRDRALYESLEESSDAWSMALQIHESASRVRRVRIFLITDGLAAIEYLEPEEVEGVEVHRSIWDIGRLFRLARSGERGEPIEIDFLERFGRPLPCLPSDLPDADYRAYLTAIPGEWLANVYDEFGSRLLEKNVRSFLQFTGKVNRGMRDTLASEESPRFFAYNNGISATASEVELVTDESGGSAIRKLRDLQIVNGGQTTASIHRSQRTGVDIRDVAVQAKITEIDGDRLEEMVPLISQYANSQNRVSLADLSSNDPFHIEIETLSRSVWAPATGSTLRQTRWFYERARGQYADALGREPTRARQKAFKEIHPRNQRIAKTDLAKFENSWAQRPMEVSKGAQKNFTAYMLELKKGFRPDAPFFQRLVAKAILFRRAEKIVSAQNFGGYRANIVTYSIAKLAHATQQRLDLGEIWVNQALAESVESAIENLAHVAFEVLTEEGGNRNVTEWAKQEACWRVMKERRWDLPVGVKARMIPLGQKAKQAETAPSDDGAGAMDGGLPEDDPLITEMSQVPSESMFAIANWAKETDNLTSWDRRFAYNLGTRLSRGAMLSRKQAEHVERIIGEAAVLGFDPPSES